jgi:hypothetical protein
MADSEITVDLGIEQPIEVDLGVEQPIEVSLTVLDGSSGVGTVAWGGITGTLSNQTDLQTALDTKVDENASITGATKTKITYDTKGLVTSGADATTADIGDSSNKRYVTDANLTVIGNTSGTNSGNQTITNTSNATTHTVTLSASGGSIQLVEGSNITLTTTGTSSDGIVTIASTASGTGDVVGPASATDNAIVRFDGTTGKLVQNSAVTIADTSGDITAGKYNKVTVTAPATGSTLTIADGQTLTVNGSATITNGTHSGTNTGDQTISLTGDVTGSGTGSFAATIANDAVTYAKIQNVTANSILARASTSSGDVGEVSLTASQLLGRGSTGDVAAITLGTNLSMSGTTLNASGGGGTPGGSNTQVQFNDSGSFGGDAGLVYDKTTNILSVDTIMPIAATGSIGDSTHEISDIYLSNNPDIWFDDTSKITYDNPNLHFGEFDSVWLSRTGDESSPVLMFQRATQNTLYMGARSNDVFKFNVVNNDNTAEYYSPFAVYMGGTSFPNNRALYGPTAAGGNIESGLGFTAGDNTADMVFYTGGSTVESARIKSDGKINVSGLTASKVVQTNASKDLESSSVSTTELGYVSGVTSAIQTQINNKQPLDATLTSLAAYNTNGLLTQTAADTFTGRTVTGTTNQITVTNGNGVSGNPTLSLPADVVIPTIITAPNTGLHVLDTDSSHDLILKPGSNLTADHTLTITTGDNDRTLTLTGDASITGTNTGDQTSVSGNAGTVTVGDAGSDTTTWILLGTSQTGNLSPATDAALTFNATSNLLTSGDVAVSNQTASRLLSTDGSSVVTALSTTTYPSLTEVSYVKGVTSALQTQLDNKQPLDADLTTIAGLTATTDNIMQSSGSAWASRTPTQTTATLINFVGDSGSGGTKGLVPAPASGDAAGGKFLKADGTWTTPSGSGDMVLASAQTVTGAKTFNDTKLLLRNVANTFNGSFVNTNTADRIYTLKDAAGTLAFTSDITGTNSGTNTGDQTSIVGITGTKAQFNTAVTDGDIVYLDSTDTITGAKTFSTAPVFNALPTGTAVASAATVSTIATRDSNGNLSAVNHLNGFRTQTAAAGTTTLVVGDAQIQEFTGSTTQTITLPVTSTLATGQTYRIVNKSSGALTVNSSGGNLVQTVAASPSSVDCICVLTSGTTAASWDVVYTTSGGSGTVTSVDAANGVETVSGSAITATGTIRASHVKNAQTGTTYTIVTGDRGKYLTLNNASPVAVTLPQAGGTFPDGWYVLVQCLGAGTATITPTTSTINGTTTIALTTNQSCIIVSDGTNYQAFIGQSSGGSGANTALSNLASVAINTSLLPGTTDTLSLGSTSKEWVSLYLDTTGTITWNSGDVELAAGTGLLSFQSTTDAQFVIAGTNVLRIESAAEFQMDSLADYAVLYGDNNNKIQGITPGTAGQVLTSNGASTAPTYVDIIGKTIALTQIQNYF